jgi:hypothetical protein
MYLYRSANYTLIASGGGSTDGPYNGGWDTADGTCLSSTWQYNLDTEFYATSGVNGSVYAPLWYGPVWISC